MDKCPACGAAIERAGAAFCSACGARVAEPAEPTVPAPAAAPTTADVPTTGEGGQAEFISEVRRAFSDGVLDEHDRTSLEDAASRLRLSDEEAADLEDQAIGDLASELGQTPPEAPAQAPPVLLENNPSHFYMEQYSAVLDFRLTNRTEEDLHGVCLTVRGRRLGEVDECRLDLAAGEARRHRMQIEPDKAGVHIVDIAVDYRAAGEGHTWAAQGMLQVLERPQTPRQVVFDQRIQAGEGAKIGFGFSYRGEGVDKLAGCLTFDANELITRDLPPRWQAVGLRRVVAAEAHGPLRVVRELADRRAETGDGGLYWPGGEQANRVLLLGQDTLRMGRNRQSDVVLRLHPRGQQNDMLSRQITVSRPHLVLSLRPNGLFLADQDTANGTRLNGQELRGEVALPLDAPSEVEVARALRLRVRPFLAGEEENAPDADRCANLGRPDRVWEMAAGLGLRSVLIERVDNLSREEEYLVIYRWANCGRKVDSEVSLPAGGQSPTWMRIIRLGGQFWLEGFSADEPVHVEGTAVRPGWACPLAPAMSIAAGPGKLQFGEFRQIGL